MRASVAARERLPGLLVRSLLCLSVLGASRTAPVSGQVVPDTTRITIRGAVVDRGSGKPILNASVRMLDTDFQTRTDERGRFTLGGLPRGYYVMSVTASGYRRRSGGIQVVQTGDLRVALESLSTLRHTESPFSGPTSRVLGRVVEMETGKPVEGAEVRLGGVQGLRVTDAQGRFEVPRIQPGIVSLSVSFLGRVSVEDSVEISRGTTVELDIRLGVKPVELKPMVVVVTPRDPYLEDMGYYRRREMGYSGRRISRRTIEERDPRHLGDLLASVPGIRVEYGGPGGFRVYMSRVIRLDNTGTSGCTPAVYLDDVPVDIGWLESVRPGRVEGMEIYTGANSPLGYSDPCGVILVWTRRGRRSSPRQPPVTLPPEAGSDSSPGARHP